MSWVPRRLSLTLAALWFAETALSGCAAPSSAERDARSAAKVRAAQARAVARQAGLSLPVQAFLATAASSSDVTYTVVYDQGGGQSTTVIAKPPDRRIDVVGASGPGSTDRVIIRNTDTVVCHLTGSRWSCQSGVESSPGGPFTPDAITQTIGSLAQVGQAYDFEVSSRRMVGLSATCLAATRRAGQPLDASVGNYALICIAPSGVILRVDDGSGTPVQATSYRESAPSSAFALPARPTPSEATTSAPPVP